MHYKGPFASRLKAWVGCRYVCLYDVEDRVLLRRVQISSNRSLDGVLDQLNSKEMTDAGPAALLDDVASDEDELLPPTTAGAAIATPYLHHAFQNAPAAQVCNTFSLSSCPPH